MAGANDFSLGKDVTLQVITATGTLNLPATVTAFDTKPQYNKLRRKGMDGVVRGANIPDGWEGTIQLDRHDSVVDDFFAAAEAGFYSGENSFTASILETIDEISGGTSQYRYTGVTLSFDDAGNKQGDNVITQTIGFFASRRQKVQ
jgi:hypothetical protein